MTIIIRRKIFDIAEKMFTLPSGRRTTHTFVSHPGAVLIIPFLTKQKIILLKQYRPVIGKYIFELPAGTIEKGESSLSCARRETIEETGYRAKRFTKIANIYPVPGYSKEIITIFKAEGLVPCHADQDEDEIINTQIVTKRDIMNLFQKGKLIDAKTICAFAYCGWL